MQHDETWDSPSASQVGCANLAATFMDLEPDSPRARAAGAVLWVLGMSSFDSPGSVETNVDLVQQRGWVVCCGVSPPDVWAQEAQGVLFDQQETAACARLTHGRRATLFLPGPATAGVGPLPLALAHRLQRGILRKHAPQAPPPSLPATNPSPPALATPAATQQQ